MLKSLSEIGPEIKAARLAMGISQLELARRAGISRPTLSSLESGKRKDLSWKRLANVCRQLPDLSLVSDANLTFKIGLAARALGLGLNHEDKLLYPINIPGVATRYDILTPAILTEAGKVCLK